MDTIFSSTVVASPEQDVNLFTVPAQYHELTNYLANLYDLCCSLELDIMKAAQAYMTDPQNLINIKAVLAAPLGDIRDTLNTIRTIGHPVIIATIIDTAGYMADSGTRHQLPEPSPDESPTEPESIGDGPTIELNSLWGDWDETEPAF